MSRRVAIVMVDSIADARGRPLGAESKLGAACCSVGLNLDSA